MAQWRTSVRLFVHCCANAYLIVLPNRVSYCLCTWQVEEDNNATVHSGTDKTKVSSENMEKVISVSFFYLLHPQQRKALLVVVRDSDEQPRPTSRARVVCADFNVLIYRYQTT